MQVHDILGVPTHVYSRKHRLPSEKPSSLVLVIPGSPGMGHFYIPFASRLFELGEGRYDVAVVSHAGHSPGYPRPPDHHLEHGECLSNISISADHEHLDKDNKQQFSCVNRDWYNLEDQIAHKLAYIRDHASHVDSLYLVGHSIGSWMVLQLLKHLEPTRVKRAVLLFPTIEKMCATPNGVKMSSLFSSWRTPFTFGVWAMSWFPEFVKRHVLRWHFHTTPFDHLPHMIQGTINIDSKAIHNILCMAHQEMNVVTEPPLEVIDTHIDKIVFYYGVNDGWTLNSCFEDMADRHPEKEVHLCRKGFDHAFVEQSSNEMADFVHSKIFEE